MSLQDRLSIYTGGRAVTWSRTAGHLLGRWDEQGPRAIWGIDGDLQAAIVIDAHLWAHHEDVHLTLAYTGHASRVAERAAERFGLRVIAAGVVRAAPATDTAATVTAAAVDVVDAVAPTPLEVAVVAPRALAPVESIAATVATPTAALATHLMFDPLGLVPAQAEPVMAWYDPLTALTPPAAQPPAAVARAPISLDDVFDPMEALAQATLPSPQPALAEFDVEATFAPLAMVAESALPARKPDAVLVALAHALAEAREVASQLSARVPEHADEAGEVEAILALPPHAATDVSSAGHAERDDDVVEAVIHLPASLPTPVVPSLGEAVGDIDVATEVAPPAATPEVAFATPWPEADGHAQSSQSEDLPAWPEFEAPTKRTADLPAWPRRAVATDVPADVATLPDAPAHEVNETGETPDAPAVAEWPTPIEEELPEPEPQAFQRPAMPLRHASETPSWGLPWSPKTRDAQAVGATGLPWSPRRPTLEVGAPEVTARGVANVDPTPLAPASAARPTAWLRDLQQAGDDSS